MLTASARRRSRTRPAVRPVRRPVTRLIVGGFVALVVLGCQRDEDRAPPCDGIQGTRVKGKKLVGDVDADGKGDRVTLRVDTTRPARCRHLLVVQATGGNTVAAAVPPLSWPGTDPQLLLLSEIDGRAGLEPVIELSPAAVYRPGAVFTLRQGKLFRMRLERVPVSDLFPLYDEFPAGVDCAGPAGGIVVTQSRIATQDDGQWDVTRSFYRAAGTHFDLVRDERFRVDVGPEAGQRWPEVLGDPFLRCGGRVG